MIVPQFGSSDVFQAADIPEPTLQPGHVKVRIQATSVNTVDTMIRQMGSELPISPQAPAILGMDFAGIVDAVADDVSEFRVGDEVYGCAGGLADLPGTLAEFIVADVQLVAHKPKTLSMREAAALPLCGITAYEGLQRAGVQHGQQVLVHGGSGGVGHIAIQLAQAFGADVVSTGGGDAQIALIESLGAVGVNYKTTSVADYVAAQTQGKGFDVVFDAVGGANLLNSFEAAALSAQVVSTVALVNLDLTLAHFKGLSLHVVFMLIPMLHNQGRVAHGNILREIATIVDKGQLKPILDNSQFSLPDIGQAHDRLASGQAMGKIVINV